MDWRSHKESEIQRNNLHRHYKIKLVEEQKKIEENYLKNIKGLENIIEEVESKDTARFLLENNIKDEFENKMKSLDNEKASAEQEFKRKREELKKHLEKENELRRLVYLKFIPRH